MDNSNSHRVSVKRSIQNKKGHRCLLFALICALTTQKKYIEGIVIYLLPRYRKSIVWGSLVSIENNFQITTSCTVRGRLKLQNHNDILIFLLFFTKLLFRLYLLNGSPFFFFNIIKKDKLNPRSYPSSRVVSRPNLSSRFQTQRYLYQQAPSSPMATHVYYHRRQCNLRDERQYT